MCTRVPYKSAALANAVPAVLLVALELGYLTRGGVVLNLVLHLVPVPPAIAV